MERLADSVGKACNSQSQVHEVQAPGWARSLLKTKLQNPKVRNYIILLQEFFVCS